MDVVVIISHRYYSSWLWSGPLPDYNVKPLPPFRRPPAEVKQQLNQSLFQHILHELPVIFLRAQEILLCIGLLRRIRQDRFRDADYVPRSYFKGAVPANDYKPSEPYTVTVSENPYTYQNEGYAKMFLTSGGADSQRFVMLRKAKDDKWYLWEQFILVGIRPPESTNPWA